MTSNTSDISVMSSDLSSHCQQIVVNHMKNKIKNYESLLKNCNNEFREVSDSHDSESEPKTDLELLLKAENLLLKYELRRSVAQMERQKNEKELKRLLEELKYKQ